ncbi:zinc ABC transporter substrate-binding protein [Parafrigoribacterium mesophilum]|uniref:metal ABC transporter solute-binding protein, Zn/Mn family n=1 Tax=Parafrigoribacterium mesophilum TaxID=433646 RepID=UPI0031FD58C3
MRAARTTGIVVAGVLAVSALAGCASTAVPSHQDGRIAVVASTSVYGDIARAIGGDAVAVTALITDPAQDPHSFEASAQDQLAVAKAQVVVENGGGYDDFVDSLLSGSGARPEVVNAVTASGLDQDADGFNEHVWYDLPAMRKVGERLAAAFSTLEPARSDDFTAGAAAFTAALAQLERDAATVKEDHAGDGVAVTEPVPLYLLAACGLVDKTPAAFSRAVEDGSGVAPALMHATLELFTEKRVRLLVYNAQTSGPETEQLRAAAKASGIPTVAVTETLPQDATYLSWMRDNLAKVKAALTHG